MTPPSANAPPLTVAITGATGLIGSALTAALRAGGHVVRRVTRTPREPGDFAWNPDARQLDPGALAGADAVVHLAGASVAHRWTDEHKRAIRDSRVAGTTLIAESIAAMPSPPRALVSASAIGYYGDRGDEPLTESSPSGTGFLADVCREWEGATAAAERAGVRVVHMRTGLVLSPDGGLLKTLLPPFRIGLGGKLGDGRAWMSCISLHDVVGAYTFAVTHDALRGVANLVGPEQVTNEQFSDTLGRVLHRPVLATVPKFGLRLLLGEEQADEMALASQRVVPEVLPRAGYAFAHPTVDAALRAELA